VTRDVSAPRSDRDAWFARGRRLEVFTVAWNVVEAIVSIIAGALAGSTSLIGFGIDSVIESLSGSVLLWRLARDDPRREGLARKLVAVTFFLLAAYVGLGAGRSLVLKEPPDASLPGVAITALSVLVMPILARAKRRVAAEIDSASLVADSRQTDICAYLSAILLVGLALNAWLGWWWADPAAGLLMVPIIAWEGREAWLGEECDACRALPRE
jgi:divalent metal cation (Fe/Co/Zn/Cd) transporter